MESRADVLGLDGKGGPRATSGQPQYDPPSHTQHLPASQSLSLSLLGVIRLEDGHCRDACGGVKGGPSKICLLNPLNVGLMEKGFLADGMKDFRISLRGRVCLKLRWALNPQTADHGRERRHRETL